MDAKTPPIPSKHREREEERNRRNKGRDKSPEPVSLPPLTPLPDNANRQSHQCGSKNSSESAKAPCVIFGKREHRDAQRTAYRVLEIGATPLMHACQQGDRARVLKLLRERRETLGYRDRALRSALHYCMDAGTAGAVASAAPDLVNAPDAEGHTPLHLAVIAGDAQLVAVLLANGANVNAKDSEGHGVLHWATVCGEAECARLILAAGARPSSPDLRGGSPLHYAAQCCGAATATTRLSVPKRVGLKVLGTLLEFGADVDARDEDGRQPILWAASAGSVEAVLALARAGGAAAAGATDKDGLTALHCAASRGHASCVEALVNLCGCHPDHVDDNGCSALHYAATLGHAEATALLLRLGADPNRRDRRGRTPALCAAAKGQLETLKMVAQHGGSLQARTVRGTGLAHEAVLSGRAELIQWLAEKRPGILDLATNEGKTPLHVAALHGHLDICKVLLDHGAKVNAILRTSKNGPMTALDAALYRGHRDCAKLLQMHGGTTARNFGKRDTSSPDRRPPPAAIFESNRCKHNNSSNGETSRESSVDDRGRNRRRRSDRCYSEERWDDSGMRRRRDRGAASGDASRESSEPRHRRRVSGSFSDEDLRVGKSSRRRERRSHPRYCRRRHRRSHDHLNRDRRARSQGENLSRPEYGGSRSDTTERYSEEEERRERDDEDEDDDHEIRSEKRHSRLRDRRDDDEQSATSDDSLRVVVVVKKSLERTSERVRISKTPRRRVAHRRERRELSRERQARKRTNASETRRQRTSAERVSDRTRPPERSVFDKSEANRSRVVERDVITDSTSQEKVERVTVTALVHEDIMSTENLSPDEAKDMIAVSTSAGKEGSDPSSGTRIVKETSEERQQMSGQADSSRDSATVEEQKRSEIASQDGEETGRTEVPSEWVEAIHERDGGETVIESTIVTTSTASETGETPSAPINEVGDGGEETAKQQITIDINGPENRPTSTPEEHDLTERDEKSGEKSGDSSSRVESTNEEKADGKKETTVDEVPSERPDKDRKDEITLVKTGESRDEEHRSGDRTSGDEYRSDRSAIVAVIEDPEWDVTEGESDGENTPGISKLPASTSEEESRGSSLASKRSAMAQPDPSARTGRESRAKDTSAEILRGDGLVPTSRSEKQRRDSGGRDSGIEPSPRVSKIPKRMTMTTTTTEIPRLYTERQGAFDDETVTRDVQISLRRYHLERKIFFQLMELKRLQIRHGRANERVLVKRQASMPFSIVANSRDDESFLQLVQSYLQVEAFNKAGMTGPILGVVKHFEAFLYDQLRRLQRRSATPDSCTEAKQCTRKTHRCHHATSAYTSMPVYAYLGGGGGGAICREREDAILPRIETQRGRGRMTVEVTKGEEKRVIALPSEQLDRTKRYYVTFTVRGEQQEQPQQQQSHDEPASPREAKRRSRNARRNAQSV